MRHDPQHFGNVPIGGVLLWGGDAYRRIHDERTGTEFAGGVVNAVQVTGRDAGRRVGMGLMLVLG